MQVTTPNSCVAIALVLGTACSGSTTPTAQRSPIDGTVQERSVSAAGMADTAADVSAVGFRAYVRDLDAATGYTAYPAAGPVMGDASGRFTIPEVPEGDFLLAILVGNQPPEFRAFHDHAVTIVEVGAGRADAVPASSPALLDVSLTGLTPWSLAADQLVADSWEVGTECFGVEGLLTPRPSDGATTIDGVFDWASPYSFAYDGIPRLMDPSKGDTFAISRLTTLSSNGHSITTMTQQGRVPAPAQQQGQQTAVAVAVADVVRDQHVQLTASFHAALAAPDATAHAYTTEWDAEVIQAPFIDRGITLGAPELLISGTEPDVTTAMNFGLPYPSSPAGIYVGFVRRASVSMTDSAIDLTDNQFTLAPLSGSAYVAPDLDLFADARIGGVTIPGLDLHATGAVQMTVRLPAGVESFTLDLMTTDANPQKVARFVSDGDSLDIPAEVFTTGTYVLRISLDGQDGSTYLSSVTNLGPVSVAR